MPRPEVVIPLIEGVVGSTASGKESVALFVKQCKEIMLMTAHKDQDDWSFIATEDIDETANDLETGGVLYGLLLGTNSADAELDWVVVSDDADGTLTYDGTAAQVNDVKLQVYLPAAATDGTEELHPYVFPEGISFTNHMCIGADGQDGTNPAANDIRGWALLRTTAGVLA